jgi:steroid delta-isomerase-like uncharacterized protein
MGAAGDLWNQFEILTCKKDFAGLGSLFADDAVHVDPLGRQEGREAIVALYKASVEPFSDISLPPSLLIEQGDTVVAEYTWRGTHTGPLTMPDGSVFPALGKVLSHDCVTIAEVKDGRFVALRDYFDLMVGLKQLGLMPET